MAELEQSDPRKTPFTPKTLDRTVIAIPLLEKLNEEKKDGKMTQVVRHSFFPSS